MTAKREKDYEERRRKGEGGPSEGQTPQRQKGDGRAERRLGEED